MTTSSPAAARSGTHGTPGGELRGLTGLRAVAAMWVVLFHFHFTPLPGVGEVVDVLGPLVTAGALGVDLFFVLSGFVIARTYLDQLGPALRLRPTVRFVWARVVRLWPVYAVVLHLFGGWLLVRTVVGTEGEVAFQAVQPVLDVGQYIQQLVLVQLWDDPYFDGASWVGPTWSVSAEWLAYLLFPVLALVLFRIRRLPAGVLAFAAVGLMVPMAWAYLSAGSPYFPWSWAVRILCGFGAGALVHLAVRRSSSRPAVGGCASVLAVLVPVVMGAGLLLGERVGPGRGGMVILLFPLLVAALALADRGPATVLATSVPVYGGRLSYALYLVHIPLLEVYWSTMTVYPWLTSHTVLAHVVGVLVVPAAVAVAALAYHFVEEPSRRRLRRVSERGAISGEVGSARTVPPSQAGATAGDALTTAPARFAAKRRAQEHTGERHHTVRSEGRHAASPTRGPTLVTALVSAQQRRAAHRSPRDAWDDCRRTEYVRSAHLQPGS